MNKDIIIYQTKNGEIELRHDSQKETILANLNQIAGLFGVGKAAVSKHLKNIFESGELSNKTTVSKMETVQKEGKRSVKRSIEVYSLDAIIAVGYRINSKKATHFRVWATKTLKDYLVNGYIVNQKRLDEVKLDKFEKTVGIFKGILENKKLNSNESEGLLRVITDYADSWAILQKYDEGKLKLATKTKSKKKINYKEVNEEIIKLKSDLIKKKQATEIFGIEREYGLEAIIGNVYQTFSKKELYLSLEEKASHFLYFIIKDHPFVDGNKRIACFLFISFLMKNKHLYKKDGEKRFDSSALVALALLVAESKPKDKDVIVDLIINFIAIK